jgi:hypothetical protein
MDAPDHDVTLGANDSGDSATDEWENADRDSRELVLGSGTGSETVGLALKG